MLEQFENLSIEMGNKTIPIVETLKSIPRSGKSVRLSKFGINLPRRSIYDHITSLPAQARFFLSISKSDVDLSLLDSMLIFHDLSEAVIGDSPSFTSQQLALHTFMAEEEKSIMEEKVNGYIQELLPDHLKSLFTLYQEHHLEKKSFLYRYFHMVDKTDPIIAIWRYLFLFRKEIEIDRFLTAMEDFFLNPSPQKNCLDPTIRSLIGFLQNPSHARKYHSCPSNFFHASFDAPTADQLRELIEDRPMHFVQTALS